ncbi:MAG: hypothetical protein HYU41_26040 [Candidatus Rokubacteria bacterium]|nr:hypothetical protein [Candidatus Rokubacteria bacterium]
MPPPSPPVSSVPPVGYHGAVSALGLQRTYLLRLIRELGVAVPPPPERRRVVESRAS